MSSPAERVPNRGLLLQLISAAVHSRPVARSIDKAGVCLRSRTPASGLYAVDSGSEGKLKMRKSLHCCSLYRTARRTSSSSVPCCQEPCCATSNRVCFVSKRKNYTMTCHRPLELTGVPLHARGIAKLSAFKALLQQQQQQQPV